MCLDVRALGHDRIRLSLSFSSSPSLLRPPSLTVYALQVLWASHMPMFVAGGVYGSIMVCSAMDGQRLRSLRAHTYAIHDMALSRDDTWLLSASEDATARVFSLR
jgi:WD40 repeat protein